MTTRRICPECGRAPAMRLDGLLRVHRTPQGDSCPGSMRPPVELAAEGDARECGMGDACRFPDEMGHELIEALGLREQLIKLADDLEATGHRSLRDANRRSGSAAERYHGETYAYLDSARRLRALLVNDA